MPIQLTGQDAWKNLLKSPHSRWGAVDGEPEHAARRLAAQDIFIPVLRPYRAMNTGA